MRRREFITLLGGAAASWPLTARAQQGVRTRRVGVQMNLASDDQEGQARIAAFQQGLQELGWSVGRNLRIDYRWGSGDDRFRKNAAELVALAPDVILAVTSTAAVALQRESRDVPIVFVSTIDLRFRARGCGLVLPDRPRRGSSEPDAPHPLGLLRERRERPQRRAAKQTDELAAPHSITSSARASSVGGMSMLSVFAISRLMISSNLVGCCTGKSAGFAPLRIRPV
jgi:ABC transporter substrate binding protein